MKKTTVSIILGTWIACSLLTGCRQENNTASDPVTNAESMDVSKSSAENTIAEPDTRSLTISVLNLTNFSIGMFSVIDPVTNEQINMDGMEPGESIEMECNWPADTASFQWALYNQSGELCIDASTDIKDAENKVILALTGDTTIEDVKVGLE